MGGQAKIYGSVATGPTGTIIMSSPAQVKVGTIAHVEGGGLGIQTNRYAKDMNVAYPNVDPPFEPWGPLAKLPTPLPIATGPYAGFYNDSFNNGDHSLTTMVIPASQQWIVTGVARIYVKQDVLIEGGLVILPGASLQLYVEKGTVLFKGNGFRNGSGYAGNFGLWCMPLVTTVSFSGDGNYVGTVYAPNSTLNLTGVGATGLDFQGAAVANVVNASGGYKFHYDEQLQNTGLRNLQIASWKEI
jgi:hypothetical protein